MAIVRVIALGDGKERPLAFTHFALREMAEVAKVPAWLFLLQPKESLETIQVLAWGALQRWMYSDPANMISFRDFLQGPLLPEFLSPAWFQLVVDLKQLLDDTFPAAVQMRTSMAAAGEGSEPSETTLSLPTA